MLECHEAVPFGSVRRWVEHDCDILDWPEGGEHAAEGGVGGVKGEATDEELPKGGVAVDVEDVTVSKSRGLKNVKKLVPSEGF